MLNRWSREPDGAGSGGGADSETGRGLSLRQAVERKGAALPGQQRRQQKADAVGQTRPKVWSGLGSFVEPDESAKETEKLLSRGFFFFSEKEVGQFK